LIVAQAGIHGDGDRSVIAKVRVVAIDRDVIVSPPDVSNVGLIGSRSKAII